MSLGSGPEGTECRLIVVKKSNLQSHYKLGRYEYMFRINHNEAVELEHIVRNLYQWGRRARTKIRNNS